MVEELSDRFEPMRSCWSHDKKEFVKFLGEYLRIENILAEL